MAILARYRWWRVEDKFRHVQLILKETETGCLWRLCRITGDRVLSWDDQIKIRRCIWNMEVGEARQHHVLFGWWWRYLLRWGFATTSWSAGLHYSNKYDNRHSLNGSYRFNKLRIPLAVVIIHLSDLPDTLFCRNERGSSTNSVSAITWMVLMKHNWIHLLR